MRIFEVEGESVENIISQFTKQQNVPVDYIRYEVISTGSKGLFGIGKKNAKVKINYDEKEYVKKKSKLMLDELLEKAGFSEAHIEVESDNDKITLNISADNPELLIGKSAGTLDSLQYVFDKMMNLPEDSQVYLVIDVGYYRKKKAEENIAKALAMVEKVKKTGRPFKLSPMSSILRKEVHIALKGIDGISTVSTGEGQLKQVSIIPDKPRDSRAGRGNKGKFNNRKNPRYSKQGYSK